MIVQKKQCEKVSVFSRDIKPGGFFEYTLTLLHKHRDFEVLLILDGRLHYFIDNTCYTAEKGDILLVAPYAFHRAEFFPEYGIRHICVNFDLSLLNDPQLKRLAENRELFINPLIKSGTEETARDLILQLYNAAVDKEKRMMRISALFMLLFDVFLQKGHIYKGDKEKLQNGFLDSVSDFVEKNYSKSVTSKDIAERLFMDKSYFCRVFKTAFGTTFTEYLNLYRLEVSKAALTNTSETIESVALSCGFQSLSYYGKLFKKFVGTTPAAYRRS